MPYIGNTIRAADDYRLIDDISSGFNGSTTSFALQVAGSAPVPFPKSPQQVLISVNGVIQEPDPTGSSGFNLVGTNIVFSSAPTNGHAFFGIIYATADYLNAGGNFPAGSLGAPSITFIGDENTGLYRKGSGSIGFVSDATEIANTDSNGITISSGNLIIPDSIIHNGDTDTKIRFGAANEFSVETGGVERLELTGTEAVFNDTGADTDFRIEGDTNANLFKVDAGNDRVGIGTASPQQVFHVYHAADNGLARFESGDANCRIDLKDNSGQVSIEAIGDQLRFGTTSSNTERVRLTSAGRLGLGNTSPDARLSVTDTSTFTAYASSVPSVGACMQQLQNSPSSEAINNHSTIQFGVNGGTHNRVNSISAVAESASNRKLAFTFCTDSGSNRSERLRISADGHVLPGADSTYNIGANANRFANGYFDTLYGDGSNLTGITSTTINNNANNRLITGSGTANTLEAESTATYDASLLNITSTTQGLGLRLTNTSNEYTEIKFSAARTGAGSALGILTGRWNNTNDVAQIYFQSGDDTTNKDDGRISFITQSASGANGTRLRIEPAGQVLVGSTNGVSFSNTAADDLIVGSAANGKNDGITILSGSAQNGSICFADNNDSSAGLIGYVHNGDYLRFNAGSAQRARIDSDGLKFGSDSAAANALDDYEEGTWNVGFNFSNSTFNGSLSVAQGYYTKIGNRVDVAFQLEIANLGSGTSGGATITGLPYTPLNADNARGSGVVGYHQNTSGLDMPIQILIEQNQTTFPLRQAQNTSAPIDVSNMSNGFRMYCSITYFTA